jgi:hypothetical protein
MIHGSMRLMRALPIPTIISLTQLLWLHEPCLLSLYFAASHTHLIVGQKMKMSIGEKERSIRQNMRLFLLRQVMRPRIVSFLAYPR